MEALSKLEKGLASWYKKWPHLPKGLTDFLADWVWLFNLIGMVLRAFALIGVIIVLMVRVPLVTAAINATTYTGGFVTAIIISVGLSGFMIVLSAMAVMPLKAKRKRGWNLLFYIVLINLLTLLLEALLNHSAHFGSLAGATWALIEAIIFGYILFEIRDHFMPYSVTRKSKK